MQGQNLTGKLKNPNLLTFSESERPLEWTFFSLLLLISSLRFINLGGFDLQSWDEALYAVRAKSILYFNALWDQAAYSPEGLYSATHPPLYVWLTALAYKIFGINEFSARFIAALSGVGVTMFTYMIGKELYNIKVGFLAALLLTLNPFFDFWSMQGQFDMTLAFFFSISFYYYIKSLEQNSVRYNVIVGILTGLALLTKLFIALLIPFIIFVYEWLNPENRNYKRLLIIIMVSFILAFPWHLLMIITHSDFDIFFFFKQSQLFERAFLGIENNSKELGSLFFLNQLFVHLPFFTVCMVFGIISSAKTLRKDILFFWFIIYLIIVSLISTKLPVYLLLSAPPISIFAINYFLMKRQETEPRYRTIIFYSLINIVFFWSTGFGFRTAVKSFLSGSNLTFTALFSESWNLFALFIFFEIIIFIFAFKYKDYSLRIFILAVIILSYSALFFHRLVFNTYNNLNSGIKSVANIVNYTKTDTIIAVGNGINPQLSYYTEGLDIGWQPKKIFIRLDPAEGKTAVYNYLISKKLKNAYIIFEKSDYYLRSEQSAAEFIPDRFFKMLDTKEYALYATGNRE